ncbi:transposase [bacterium]|nr:transposase [bacterium]
MRVLEAERKGRRDDFPLRAMWNSLIAFVVFGHGTTAALLREMGRNGELRDLCGFYSLGARALVPTESVFSRFLGKLRRHRPRP